MWEIEKNKLKEIQGPPYFTPRTDSSMNSEMFQTRISCNWGYMS